jgi:hypothetical protein
VAHDPPENPRPPQVQTRARGVTQTYSAHSFKDFTVGGDTGLEGAWLRAGPGVAVLAGREEGPGLGVRGQFDRRSQLRRSKKQGRRKSSASGESPVKAAGGESSQPSSPSPGEGTLGGKQEMRDKFTHILNTSRTEYNSNYGNLI